MKKKSILILLVLFILLPSLVRANDYQVDNYNLYVEVLNDKVYKVSENINLTFNKKNVLVTKEVDKNVKDIEVSENYIIGARNKKNIKINSGNKLTSSITYKYKLNNDSSKKDVYKINIDNSFNEDLKNIEFVIKLPQELITNNISFYLNDKEIKNINYKIENDKLTGTYEFLKVGDYLTIKVDYGKIYLSTLTITAIIFPIILSLISFILWCSYGKDLKYTPERTTKIGKNLTPLDVSLIYNGKAQKEDLIYTLLHLANKGYIKIIEKSNNNFMIKKIKEYDGKDYKEVSFLKALFRKNTISSVSDYLNYVSEQKNPKKDEFDKIVTNSDLPSRLARIENNILTLVNNDEEKNKYFEKTAEKKRNYLLFMIAAILVLVTSLPFIEINKLYFLPISVIFSIVTLHILLNFINNIDKRSKKEKIYILIAFAAITLIIILLPTFRRNKIYILAFLVGCFCVGIILFLYKYMPKRTIFGTRNFAKIEGVKMFLDNVTNEELNNVLSLNENYLYDILPFSYIIDSNHIVLKKLKELGIKKPDWYELEDGYTVQKFNNSLKRLMKKVSTKDEE